MTTFRFATREQWGFKILAGRTPAEEVEPDTHGVLHHVGGSGYMSNDAFEVFRLLNRVAHGKGHWGVDYDALGHYDFANDVFTLGQGNWGQRSAATLDFNEEGEALCLCGNYELRPPHPAEVEGAAWGFAQMVNAGLIVNPPTLIGHFQNPKHPGASQCPGELLIPHLPAIHTRVVELLNPEDDMPTAQETAEAVWSTKRIDNVTKDTVTLWEILVRARSDANNALRAALETKALVSKLPSSGGVSAAAIAKAVLDEDHRRSAG